MTHAALKDLEAGLPRGHGVTTLRCQLWEAARRRPMELR